MYKYNAVYRVFASIVRGLKGSFRRHEVTFYIHHDDIKLFTSKENTFFLYFNQKGLSRIKTELNLKSKNAVSLICANDQKDMLKITYAPDISHVFCVDHVRWTVSDERNKIAQRAFLKEFSKTT